MLFGKPNLPRQGCASGVESMEARAGLKKDKGVGSQVPVAFRTVAQASKEVRGATVRPDIWPTLDTSAPVSNAGLSLGVP